MLQTLIRRAVTTNTVPFNIHNNPYKAKRLWPPDFSKLSAKHQFRLERRYRRRAKLKWARPGWTKAVKLTQYGAIIFVAVYGTLFMDFGTGGTPFDGVRDWYSKMVSTMREPSNPSIRSEPSTSK